MQASKKRVGILRGGIGEHYESSLKEGGNIISHISENLPDKFKVVDIFIDNDGVWHVGGLPVIPGDLVHKVDVVWNATHPTFAKILEPFSIPVVGASHFSSTVAKNRVMLAEHMKNFGVDMPRHIVFPLYQADFDGSIEEYAKDRARKVFQKFSPPWIVRPFSRHSNMGVHVAKTFGELENAIIDGAEQGQSILVEELISGKMGSIHSIRGFRGEEVYTLPIGNLLGHFTAVEKEKIADFAKKLHRHLATHTYMKSNFVITKNGKVYLTGVLFTPNVNSGSHFCASCDLVGAKPAHVIEHMLEEAL